MQYIIENRFNIIIVYTSTSHWEWLPMKDKTISRRENENYITAPYITYMLQA